MQGLLLGVALGELCSWMPGDLLFLSCSGRAWRFREADSQPRGHTVSCALMLKLLCTWGADSVREHVPAPAYTPAPPDLPEMSPINVCSRHQQAAHVAASTRRAAAEEAPKGGSPECVCAWCSGQWCRCVFVCLGGGGWGDCASPFNFSLGSKKADHACDRDAGRDPVDGANGNMAWAALGANPKRSPGKPGSQQPAPLTVLAGCGGADWHQRPWVCIDGQVKRRGGCNGGRGGAPGQQASCATLSGAAVVGALVCCFANRGKILLEEPPLNSVTNRGGRERLYDHY